MLKFTPKKEEELQSKFDPLPPGKYPFTVLESAEVESKSEKNLGKKMVKLKIDVHGPKYSRHVFDYFSDWFSEWKLKHFCDTVGLSKDYNSGTVDASDNAFAQLVGYVEIGVENNPQYGPKNIVEDYFCEEKKSNSKSELSQDDVPF